mmetsp:Transcript_6077/g.17062  ORF Transcript_6077/g.17062 Transcript_6077/m.17062 type:complete len:809 (-) Transcript_6077:618-3044(-)
MQDAPLKPAVKASLLSGGIASLLYLFAILLRDLNVTLGTIPRIELATSSQLSSAISSIASAAAGCALQISASRLSSAVCSRSVLAMVRRRRLIGRALIGSAAAVGVRAIVAEIARRRTSTRLSLSADRLNLTLRLWCLATSVLQRAHRQGVSYIQLQGLEASNVQRVASSASLSLHGHDESSKLPGLCRSGSNSSFSSALFHDSNNGAGTGGSSLGGLVRGSSGMNLVGMPALCGGAGTNAGSGSRDGLGGPCASFGGAGGGAEVLLCGGNDVGGLRASASYPQLIAQPGLHDIDTREMNPTRVMFDLCVPWSDSAFWWRFNPILDATKRVMDTYMAAMLTALRIVARADLPVGAAYALAIPLIAYFAGRPSAAAAEVWAGWWEPDMLAYQAIYAPLRWPITVRLVRRTVGRDILHEERRIAGRRIVMMQTRRSARAWAVRYREAAARGEPPPERPTVLFVPGGAFITDFEAADYFFLHRWVRQCEAIVVYVCYDYAPQVPYPGPMLCVLRVYRALRSHAHDLGFRASPLVVAGLSAGGNLAMSALLAPLLLHHAPPSLIDELIPARRLSPCLKPTVRAPVECASAVSAHTSSNAGRAQGALGSPGPAGSALARAAGNSHEEAGLPPPLMPDAILLLCPVLNLCRSPSPSRVVFASDVLLPQPMLKAFATAYDSDSDHWKVRDPLLSPVFAPDEALKQLPPVTLLCGGLDPLLDDSVDFNTRIRRMGVPGDLHIYRSLPHTFVSFPHWHILPEVEAALATTVRYLRSVCARGEQHLQDFSSRSDDSDFEDQSFSQMSGQSSDPLGGLS